MNQSLDLTPAQRETLQSIVEKHLPNATVWAYGSRVKGTSRPTSDLDLVVFTPPDRARDVSQLREALEESSFPFRVDLFVWDDIPESFRPTIEQDHITLLEGLDYRSIRDGKRSR